MNYMQIETCSVSNFLGFRVVLWVSGCSIGCVGCHNQETWDFKSGHEFTEKSKRKLFELLGKPYIKGITFSGGHPLEDQNIYTVYSLILEIKQKYPDKDICLYTGLTIGINDLMTPVLRECDYIIDGAFEENKRDLTLAFRGSSNQRIILVKESLKNGHITEWTE